MRRTGNYGFAVLLSAVGAAGVQIAQVMDGRSTGHAFAAFLVLWLAGAVLLCGVVALRQRGTGGRPPGAEG